MHQRIHEKLPKLTPLYADPQLLSTTDHQLPVWEACVVNLAGTPTWVFVVERLGEVALLGDNLLKGAVIDMPRMILRL